MLEHRSTTDQKAVALYHVTYWRRLDSIDTRGLVVGASRSIGSAGYDAHVKGKIFLTETDGVFFWISLPASILLKMDIFTTGMPMYGYGVTFCRSASCP